MGNNTAKEIKIGLLGGGQLGRMVIQSAISYNIDIHVMDEDPNAPCKSFSKSFYNASLKNYDAVMEFGKDKDLITVEIENINIEALETLQSQGKKIYPQPNVLKIIKDKGLQKQFYIDNHFPTAPFIFTENLADIQNNADYLPAVNKIRTGGYDGKGVVILSNENDIKNGFDAPGILEKLIPFQKEISVIVARNENGETIAYPAVECEFNPQLNLVEYLFAPADITQEVENKAKSIAIDLISKLEMVGILAVEFFLLENGELLVNEIAPRPHNSGHHTIECNFTSQFEQHLRAILNFPLGSTDIILPGVMINLLGEPGFEGEAQIEGLNQAMQQKGVYLHLYGKKQTKPHRKMGHITVALPDLQQAKSIAKNLAKTVKIIA